MKSEQNWLQRRIHLKMLMDRGKVITIAHPEQRSGELKKKKSHPPWRPWFLTYHDGLNNLGRKLQKKHSCRVIFKIGPVVSDKKIFKLFCIDI